MVITFLCDDMPSIGFGPIRTLSGVQTRQNRLSLVSRFSTVLHSTTGLDFATLYFTASIAALVSEHIHWELLQASQPSGQNGINFELKNEGVRAKEDSQTSSLLPQALQLLHRCQSLSHILPRPGNWLLIFPVLPCCNVYFKRAESVGCCP